eukprot:TRINITY_DN11670_c0_g1_i1.p1 TRINITY_DN11670_c0_g1~~TRINITY_DN11670_c0_g1_i1.p1  ORF type:complete len:158 (+),score=42.87 TRINITY_DN11670_c0_g1_i1:42-476(+)
MAAPPPAGSSIFSRIVRGEIPCSKVYETPNVLAFLDINPVNKGHVLVIPKEEYRDIFELPPELMAEVSTVTQKIAKAVKAITGCEGINLLQNNGKASGQEVFHFHFHIIPRFKDDGVKFRLAVVKYDEGEAAVVAAKIRGAIPD